MSHLPYSPQPTLPNIAPNEQRDWDLRDTLMQPVTRVVVGMQLRGLARREKLSLLHEEYKANPTPAKLAMIIGNTLLVSGTAATIGYIGYRTGAGIHSGADTFLPDIFDGGDTSNAAVPNPAPATEGLVNPPTPSDETQNNSHSYFSELVQGAQEAIEHALRDKVNNDSTIRDTLKPGIFNPNQAYEVTLPEWDADTGKGSIWEEVTGKGGLADFVGFDTLTREEKDEIVQRVLDYNDMSWDDAEDINKFTMPPQNTVHNWLTEIGAKYNPDSDEGLKFIESIPNQQPESNNDKYGSVTYGDQEIVVQKDGDVVVGGKEIDTAVAPNATLDSYLDNINAQLEPAMRLSDNDLKALETMVLGDPEVVKALGINPADPSHKLAYSGNLPAAVVQAQLHDALAVLAELENDKTDAPISPSPKTTPNATRPYNPDELTVYSWAAPTLNVLFYSTFIVATAVATMASVRLINWAQRVDAKQKALAENDDQTS